MTSWLFLAVACLGAFLSYNALFPERERWWALVPSFLAGWLTSELALHHLALQALIGIAFVQAGALRALPGQLALALTVPSWGALVWCVVLARRTRSVVERALEEGLGARLHEAERSPLGGALAAPVPRARLLVPFSFRHRDVERIPHLAYADTTRRNTLDVYRRRERTSSLSPVVLQIHGGGWVFGHKRQQAMPMIVDLAARGLVCVSVNYRLSPRATFPDHLIDVKRALVWVRRHIAEYGGDPGCVIVTGGSAGGHLAALLALTPNDARFQPGDEDVDTRVQGCVAFYGVYDCAGLEDRIPDGLIGLLQRMVLKKSFRDERDAYVLASPLHHVRPDAPPFFVIQGTHDSMVPTGMARSFVRALRATSQAPVVYAELHGAQHAFEIYHSIRTHHVIAGVRTFLAVVTAGQANDSSAAA